MDSPIIKLPQGQLLGSVGLSYIGENFFKFLGIPYAKPPIGELRFKAPLPAEPWSGVRDATKEGSRCYSREEKTLQTTGSEDCLFLNVFTKQLPKDKNANLKPVMVWIHGGAFVSGTSSPELYGPEFLLIEDVVVVSINYRLGILGFLRLKDASLDVPGNAGLKDQSLALKWVQDNIKHFGGDPGNVTIFGESAGAASVHYHILSPHSKGLFHKAILQSGTALNTWSIANHDAKKIVEKLKATVSTEKEALEILLRVPVEELYAAQEIYSLEHNITSRISFGPLIESSSSRSPFITKNPLEIIQSREYNQVPLIIGYNNMEGMLIEGMKKRMPHLTSKDENLKLENLIPWHLNIEEGSEVSKKIVQKLQEFYSKGSYDMADNIRVLLTDQLFLSGIISSVINHTRTSSHPVYLYRVSLEASLNFFKKLCDMEDIPGVCHADELGYIFKTIITPEEILTDSLEDVSIRRFVKLWTSFAKLGKMDREETGLEIDWKPVTENERHFLDIDKDLTTGVDPENERVNLWRDIYRMSDSPLVENYF